MTTLNNVKNAFFQEGFDAFKNEVVKGDFTAYRSVYRYPEELQGRPDFALRNFVSGLCNQISDSSQKLFARIGLSRESDKIRVSALWITNIGHLDFPKAVDDIYDLFTWSAVETNDDFLNEFSTLEKEGELCHRRLR